MNHTGYKSLSILLSFLAVSSLALAQNLSRFGLRVGPRFNLNSVNPNGDRLQGVNTVTGGIAAVYDLRLKNNICFEAGLSYGSLRQKVRFVLPLSNFDPLAVDDLQGTQLEFIQNYTLPYVGLHIAAGHSFVLKPRYRLDVMGGVSGIWYLRGYHRVSQLQISYREDNQPNYKGVIIHERYESLGSGDRSTTPTPGKFETPSPNFDVYALLRKEVKTYVFHEINLGLRVSCYAYLNGTTDLDDYYLEKIDGPKTLETYTSRNLGFQLTIGGSF